MIISFLFKRLTPAALATFAELVVLMMTGNAYYATPSPTLAAITSKVGALRTAITRAEEGSKAQKAERDTLFDQLVVLLIQLAGYVENTVGVDRNKIVTSGFNLRRNPVPVGPLGDVKNVRVLTPGTIGDIEPRWKRLAGAYTYEAQVTQTPEVANSWAQKAVVSRARATISGLDSLEEYYVRVRGIGAAGPGPWSEVANGFAR